MNNKKGWLSILVFGMVLLLASTAVACSQPSGVNETNETEEPEGYPIYVSSLALELNNEVMQEALIPFLYKYPVTYEESIPVQTFHFGMGGVLRMSSTIPAENVVKAKEHIENATSLLKWGRFPNEIKSRPLDKNEVAKELEDAKSLLEEQRFLSLSWEQGDLEWANQSDSADINNERTFKDISDTHKDYRQRLSTMITELDKVLSQLPNAIED